jgi:hypothetical protein
MSDRYDFTQPRRRRSQVVGAESAGRVYRFFTFVPIRNSLRTMPVGKPFI